MLQRIWTLCCSLKLAIIITSTTTLVAIAGSLLMHFNPAIFGNLDAMSLSLWHQASGSRHSALSSWFYLTGGLLMLLALNTTCCFIDWMFRFKARWRKAGEYMIHLGFVLIVIGYFWGSFSGTRSEGNTFYIGQARPVDALPGHYLHLDSFEPTFNSQGRPVDMHNMVSLYKGDQLIRKVMIKTNTPLIYEGLTIVPASFGQETIGYVVILTESGRTVEIASGRTITLKDGALMEILKFYSDAEQIGNRVVQRSNSTINPAMLIRMSQGGEDVLHGWMFLRKPLPTPMQKAGFAFAVRTPLTRPYSVLTINSDPGLPLALTGSVCMTIGVVFALFSYYDKRRRGDRPEII